MNIRKIISVPVLAAVSFSVFISSEIRAGAINENVYTAEQEEWNISADESAAAENGMIDEPSKPEYVFDEESFLYTDNDSSESVFKKDTYIPSDETVYVNENSDSSEGQAYAVVTESNELIFFRSKSAYTSGSTGTFTDIKGNTYKGTVYADFENPESSFSSAFVPQDKRADILSVRVAAGQVIQPVSTGSWFYNFSGLKNADLTGLDTSKVKNMSWMFRGCSSLENVDLSGLDTGNVIRTNSMFAYCSSLKELDVSSFDMHNNTAMDEMFYCCSGLSTLDLSSFDTGKTEAMDAMFRGCTGLKSINLSGFDTSSVINMRGMFAGCSSLESLDLSSFDTHEVLSMDEMFAGCSRLESLDLSNFDTANTSGMDSMFFGCGNLKSLDTGSFSTANVANMSFMFYGCSSLNHVDVSSFDTENVAGMQMMFAECGKLENLDVSGFNTGNAINMAAMFSGCSSLEKLDVSGFDTGKVTNMSSMFTDCSSLCTLDVSHFDTSAVTDMSTMFQGCSSLNKLDVSSFSTDLVTDMKWMFAGCGSLEELDVSSFDTSCVTDMSMMFYGCTGLTSLDVSGFRTDQVTNLGWMFEYCRNLSELDVSGFDTGNVTYMGVMFYGCTGLKSLDVSHFDTSKVTSMNAMFGGCENLEALDVSHFVTAAVTDMSLMFKDCAKLKAIDVSGFNTSKVYHMGSMFYGCSRLKTLNLSSFDTSAISHMGSMFYNCGSLESVQLGKKFTKWVDSGYLPSGTWTNKKVSVSLSAEELYKQYPGHADSWSGKWEKEEKNPQSVQLNKTEASVRYGSTLQLKATVKPDNAYDKTVIWSSADENIATVDSSGTVKGTGIGVTVITAKTNNNLTAACEIRVLFKDVASSSQYYFEAVYWAYENGITVGAGGAGKFSPQNPCTREQIVTFLWRLMKEPEPETESDFTDVVKNAWYYKPITWAYENQITTGLNDGTGRFGVGQPCTREQCVTFLYRAAEEPEVTEHMEFTDVTEDRYFYDAISWAASKGITVGLNDGTGRFGVGQKCTRAMIGTFLYRYAMIYGFDKS